MYILYVACKLYKRLTAFNVLRDKTPFLKYYHIIIITLGNMHSKNHMFITSLGYNRYLPSTVHTVIYMVAAKLRLHDYIELLWLLWQC